MAVLTFNLRETMCLLGCLLVIKSDEGRKYIVDRVEIRIRKGYRIELS